MFPVRTILHPTDFSRQSECAFRLACALARDHGATLIVLHVIRPPVAICAEGAVLTEPATWREEVGARVAAIKPPTPEISIGHRLVEGDPVAEIVRVAQQIGAELVVMGTHGWTGLSRVLMGSVAEGVVRLAPCPVLTVKAPLPSLRRAESAERELAAVAK